MGNIKSTARQLSDAKYREVLEKIFGENEDPVEICMLLYKHFRLRFFLSPDDKYATMGLEYGRLTDGREIYGTSPVNDGFSHWFMDILVPHMSRLNAIPMFSSKNELKMKLELREITEK